MEHLTLVSAWSAAGSLLVHQQSSEEIADFAAAASLLPAQGWGSQVQVDFLSLEVVADESFAGFLPEQEVQGEVFSCELLVSSMT